MKGRKTWAHHSSSEWCQVDTSAKWTKVLSGHKVDVGGGLHIYIYVYVYGHTKLESTFCTA